MKPEESIWNKKIIYILIILLFSFSFVDATPILTFEDSTPSNNTVTANNYTGIINISIVESDLSSFFLNWNGTNYTFWNYTPTVLHLGFNNRGDLGEDADNFTDVSSYGNNGTCSNCPVYNATGKYNSALEFDGVNDYVVAPDSASLSVTDNLTIELWLKTSNVTAIKGLVNKYDAGGGQRSFLLELSVTGIPTFAASSTTNPFNGASRVASRDVDDILTYDLNNPTMIQNESWESTAVGETSDLLDDAGVCHRWYAGWLTGVGTPYRLGYANSTDCINYTKQQQVTEVGDNASRNYVVEYNDEYFLFIKNMTAADFPYSGYIYLWNITNKTNPTIMNGGDPVYETNADTLEWDYIVESVAVKIIGDVWHMLIEGKPDATNYRIGYSYSNITELNWTAHRSSSAVIPTFSAYPELTYVPDRNAFLVLYGNDSSPLNIVCGYANISDNLSLAASWKTCSGYFEISDTVHVSDPSLVVTNFTKDWNIIISYMYNQTSTYSTYSNLPLNDFYDCLTVGINCSGTWHHVVATYNTTDMNIYVDGVLSNGALTGTVPGSIADSSRNLAIGASYSNSATPNANFFNGTIDEVRIYNRYLSADEVLFNYYSNLEKYNTSTWYFQTNITDDSGTYNYSGWANNTASESATSDTQTITLGSSCACTTCDECETKLNNVSCSIIYLTANITDHAGTCIDDPANFTNKTFDCQGHSIDGDDTGTDYGIYLSGKENNSIVNCIISDFYTGIYTILSSNNLNLTNNTIASNTQYGIYLWNSSGCVIEDNVFTLVGSTGLPRPAYLRTLTNSNMSNNTINCTGVVGGDEAIYLNNNSENNIIADNNISDCAYGIKLTVDVNNNNVTGNILTSNVWGILTGFDSENNIITNNTVNSTTWDGLFLSSANNIINSNTFCNNGRYDINAVNISNSGDNNTCDTVSNWNDTGTIGCTYACNGDCNCDSCSDCNERLNDSVCSIVLLGSSITDHSGTCIDDPPNFNNKILDCQNNIIDGDDTGSDYGVSLLTQTGNIIRNCNISDFYYGIRLIASSHNNNITNNVVTSNFHDGIILSSSDNCNLTNNTATYNTDYGIHINVGADNNNITNNTANYNGKDGIFLDTNAGNIISGCDIGYNNESGIHIQAVSGVSTTVESNNVTYNEYNGVYVHSGFATVTINNNTFCSNNQSGGAYYDVNDVDNSVGDDNTCTTSFSWNDTGTTGCTYSCGALSIYLINPANATNIPSGGFNFTWNASTGTTPTTATCDARLNYTNLTGTESTINFTSISCTTDTVCNYTVPAYNLSIGNYTWYVNCTNAEMSANSTTTNGTLEFGVGDLYYYSLSVPSLISQWGTFSLLWNSTNRYTSVYCVNLYFNYDPPGTFVVNTSCYSTVFGDDENLSVNYYVDQPSMEVWFDIDYLDAVDEFNESNNIAGGNYSFGSTGGGGGAAPILPVEEEVEEEVEEVEPSGVGGGGSNPSSGGFCTPKMCGFIPNTEYQIKLKNKKTGETEIKNKYTDIRGCLYVCVGLFSGDFWEVFEVLPVGEYDILVNDTKKFDLNISEAIETPFGVLPKSLKVEVDGINLIYNQTRPFTVFGVTDYKIEAVSGVEYYIDFFTLFREGNDFYYSFNATDFKFRKDEKIVNIELKISSDELDPQRMVLQVVDASECAGICGFFTGRVPTIGYKKEIPVIENFFVDLYGSSVCESLIFIWSGVVSVLIFLIYGFKSGGIYYADTLYTGRHKNTQENSKIYFHWVPFLGYVLLGFGVAAVFVTTYAQITI